MKSLYALIIVVLFWFIAGAIYYPKWKKQYTEAAISWDVSGYYHYLPAIFIYKDIRHQKWMEEINKVYLPSTAFDQSFDHPSGNKVNKYAIGQAILYTPFFLAAHAFSEITNLYPADGYSRPYQVAIWLGGLLVSILGLALLRKILNQYFTDSTTGWTLLVLGLGTNWFEYASISNGMNHTWLFTLLCALILFTIRFYRKTDWVSALGIGACLGLGVLTRFTEASWVLIPLLWGIHSIRERLLFFKAHLPKVLAAFLLGLLILSVQMFYWKYITGEWLVNSYQGQGFNWFHPKIWRGLMGVNIGWWIYSPMMLLAMFGWHGFYKKHRSIFWPVFFTSLLAIYITLSWAHWEEGGGLGQRNLIQIYPLLAFPLATFIMWLTRNAIGKGVWIIVLLANIYYTFWWDHQAHKGGFFQAGQMNTRYFYSIAGRPKPDINYFKLLDSKDYFSGDVQDVQLILTEDFETNSFGCQFLLSDSTKAACLNAEFQNIGPIIIPVNYDCGEWLRLEADFTVITREWDGWKRARWIVRFLKGEKEVKVNHILPHRLLKHDHVKTAIYFDVKIPDEAFDKCEMILSNSGSINTILFDNLRVSCFKEKD